MDKGILKAAVKKLKRLARKDWDSYSAEYQKAHQEYHDYISSDVAKSNEMLPFNSIGYMQHREQCNILSNKYHDLLEKQLESKGKWEAYVNVLNLLK